jgi:hypothetical protein
MITRISSSLISYQNGRKKGIIIVDDNRESANEYATVCIDMRAYEMLISAPMPEPVWPNMATAPLPSACRGPDGAEAARPVARAGRPAICRRNPSSRERDTEGLCLGAASLHSGHLRGTGPRTGKDPDPRRRSSRGSGAQNKPACPAMAATRRLWATTSSRYGLRRTCRLVTGRSHRPRSTWPDQARLALLAVTHRYTRTPCP